MRVRVSQRRIGGRSLTWNQKPKEYRGTLMSMRKTAEDRMVVVLFLSGTENESGPHRYEPRVACCSLRDFLRRDWERAESQLDSVPSDTMVKLGAVLNELADILNGESTAKYLPMVGKPRGQQPVISGWCWCRVRR